ncbi:hypothetical protein Bateq7PJ16_3035 [Bacillus subtilis]|nr:hypothetical protein Bateq7PJ16_3035 [Bacillus subtilis]
MHFIPPQTFILIIFHPVSNYKDRKSDSIEALLECMSCERCLKAKKEAEIVVRPLQSS